MRGGPFAETRVIELLNRRFVPFFFNTGGPGDGHDDGARAFVATKVPNPWAYFAAFAPDGRILGMTGIYDGTDEVYAFLRALLRRHPEFDRPIAAEAAALAAAAEPTDAAVALAAAQICEQLARPIEASRGYQRALTSGDAGTRASAHRGLLRVLRGDGDWPAHAAALAAAAASDDAALLATDLAIERGMRALAQRRFATARTILEPAIAGAADSPRLAELHYEAGRACWFAGDRDAAKAHWCWILEQRPDDRLAQRARLAAGAEGFPYPNHELGGFEGTTGPVGPGALDDAVAAAQRVYARLRDRLLAHEFDLDATRRAAAAEPDVALPRVAPATTDPLDRPDSLVARLAEPGDAAARAQLVEVLVRAGQPSAMSLLVAIGNERFAGRLAALVALGRLLGSAATLDDETLGYCRQALRRIARGGGDAELVAAAEQALQALAARTGERPEGAAPAPVPFVVTPAPAPDDGAAAAALPKSPVLLVASLRDGNDFRVANNRVVDALVALGQPAVAPLQAAVDDATFPGRGYAAFALGSVLAGLPDKPAAAIAALRAALGASDPYVVALARSGLRLLD